MNWLDSGRFCTESLESVAKRYKTLGFSVIPLQGARNPEHPKLPAIKWTRYQHHIPSDDEITSWFIKRGYGGIGIVCGRVSRLVVLDFDDQSLASEFRHHYADLADTFTVRSGTRSLPHFYFRIPQSLVVPTTSYSGIDLRGEGAYVVGPPTSVGGQSWVIEHDVEPRLLSPIDLRRILEFLANHKSALTSIALQGDRVQPRLEVSEFRRIVSDDALVELYRSRTHRGRNQALFSVAVMARRSDISQSVVITKLAPIHAAEMKPDQTESYSSRYAEALKTIGSAYKRSPPKPSSSRSGLSNAIREYFLAGGFGALARVLDGLYLSNVESGSVVTEAQVCTLLAKFKIGRRSILAALKASLGGQLIFQVVESPHIPPTHAHAAISPDGLSHSCEMSRGAKRVKNTRGRGRPARNYRVPSVEEIACKLGLHVGAGDALTDSDLHSVTSYRRRLHQHLLERRPSTYSRVWLSKRIGVSRWTLRRYEKHLGIQVEPVFAEQKLTWSVASTLPTEREMTCYGTFIETLDGTRYPPLRGLALRLLKQGCLAVLKHQLTNRYITAKAGVGIPTVQSRAAFVPQSIHNHHMYSPNAPRHQPDVGIPKRTNTEHGYEMAPQVPPTYGSARTQDPCIRGESGVGIPTPQQEPVFWLCPDCLNFHICQNAPPTCWRCSNAVEWEIVPVSIWQDSTRLQAWWKARYQVHHGHKRKSQRMATNNGDSEGSQILLENLRNQINALSLGNARKLINQFGEAAVTHALEILQQRKHIRSRAGFLVSLLRSNNKINDNKISASESSVDWLMRLAKSEYLSFIANANDLFSNHSDMTPIGSTA